MWYISEFLLGFTLHKTDSGVHAANHAHGTQWLEQIHTDIVSLIGWPTLGATFCIIKTSVMVENACGAHDSVEENEVKLNSLLNK